MKRLPNEATRRQQPCGCREAVLKGGLRGYLNERLLQHQGRWSG
jgi:hypothetical protein